VSTSEPPDQAAVPPPPPPQVIVQQGGSNGLGTAGFVCGLLATIFGLIPFLFFLSFVLGFRREPHRGGKGLSIAGLAGNRLWRDRVDRFYSCNHQYRCHQRSTGVSRAQASSSARATKKQVAETPARATSA
jgi:hypothetical protein